MHWLSRICLNLRGEIKQKQKEKICSENLFGCIQYFLEFVSGNLVALYCIIDCSYNLSEFRELWFPDQPFASESYCHMMVMTLEMVSGLRYRSIMPQNLKNKLRAVFGDCHDLNPHIPHLEFSPLPSCRQDSTPCRYLNTSPWQNDILRISRCLPFALCHMIGQTEIKISLCESVYICSPDRQRPQSAIT